LGTKLALELIAVAEVENKEVNANQDKSINDDVDNVSQEGMLPVSANSPTTRREQRRDSVMSVFLHEDIPTE
jgi:hypothetical protein